jgi:hypothetical protein
MIAKRSKRGNRKRKRIQNHLAAGGPSPSLDPPPSALNTAPVEVSFWKNSTNPSDDESQSPIPPLSVEELRDGPCPVFLSSCDDSWQQLQTLWNRLSSRQKNLSWLTPTPIQLQSWSILLSKDERKDPSFSMLQMAPTGSGKVRFGYGSLQEEYYFVC